ncbi:hypothetical protein [Sulfurovum sp. NBC37-1]|uniref:hypothetical protein n=1 Tax=Sulfurovum sp. (strain NBC37-1) TaxID=387093 RepID=UPI0001587642|nr:hypothetical protein [Sulfurovum sp. NBC37-1]BAF71869.1 hypothetical protein SUN_0911 [Sulfurovum sp. NBC37-1]
MKKTLLCLSLLTVLSSSATATDMEAGDVFEYLKSALHGEWKLSPKEKQTNTTAYKNKYVLPLVGTDKTAVAYKFIGFGSTLQEDLLPNTEKQMVTMYHCDDNIDCTQVLATHYCTKMNQPQFILDLNKTTKEKVIFNCNMKTKLCNSNEDHVHQIILEFSNGGKHLKSSYLGWTDQKPNKKNSIYHFDKK